MEIEGKTQIKMMMRDGRWDEGAAGPSLLTIVSIQTKRTKSNQLHSMSMSEKKKKRRKKEEGILTWQPSK